MPHDSAVQRGYALIAALAIVALAGIAASLDTLTATRTRLRRSSDTAAALHAAKVALIGYASTYRDQHPEENFGYLPCPDTTGSGSEQVPCGKAGKLALGLLPYKSLGLPELRDADGSCLWYAVSGSFKANPKAVPFNWDTQGQIAVRSADGRQRATPEDADGGAAAVIVAPGPPLPSQRRQSGCGDPGGSALYVENADAAFVDGTVLDESGTPIANDRVAWITAREIFDQVVKRRDFAAFMEDGIAALASKLGSQRSTTGNALPANPFGRQTSGYNFYAGWSDQFRYIRCAVPGCFKDGAGNGHNAVLLFGGAAIIGQPRPTSARALSDYFESALPMARGETFSSCSTAPIAFDNSSTAGRATDIALCLAP